MTGAIKFINAVKELNARMSIPNKLSGIQKKDIPALAKHAEKEANPLYPVPILLTRKELESFYYQVADWSKENDKRTNKKPA
jgi:alcohol dehydrogenase class IV